jgi:hypothetical protein
MDYSTGQKRFTTVATEARSTVNDHYSGLSLVKMSKILFQLATEVNFIKHLIQC